MTNALKVSFGAAAILLGSLLFVSVASAATITNAEWDGNLEVYGKPGAKEEVTLRISVPAGEVVENIGLTVGGSGLVEDCFAVGGSTGLQEGTHFVDRDVKLPPFTGFFDLDWRTNGIFGAIHAVDCDDSNGDMDSSSFSSVIRVITTPPSNNDDDLGSEEQQLIASLQAMIKELTKQVGCMAGGGIWLSQSSSCEQKPTPTKPPFCGTYAGASAGGTFSLQTWLVQNGFMTQAAMNTGPGTYGPKTTAANGNAMFACK